MVLNPSEFAYLIFKYWTLKSTAPQKMFVRKISTPLCTFVWSSIRVIFLLNSSEAIFFYSSRLLAWRACVCCNMRTFSGGLLTWASNIYTKNENERENLDTFWFEKCKKNASLGTSWGTSVNWVVKFSIQNLIDLLFLPTTKKIFLYTLNG